MLMGREMITAKTVPARITKASMVQSIFYAWEEPPVCEIYGIIPPFRLKGKGFLMKLSRARICSGHDFWGIISIQKM